MKNVLGYIESVLKKVYPLRVDLNKVSELSHLYMIHFDPKQFSVLQFGLDGVILNGTYADYKIVKVVTTDTVDWHTYLCDYTLLLNQSRRGHFPHEHDFTINGNGFKVEGGNHLRRLLLRRVFCLEPPEPVSMG